MRPLCDDEVIPPTVDYFTGGRELGHQHAVRGMDPMVLQTAGVYHTATDLALIPAYAEAWLAGYYKGYTEAEGLTLQEAAH